jgi:hypothetical protein
MQQLIYLRKQMAEKYKMCDPKEKPQEKICEQCQQDIYCNEICSKSGLFHNKNKTQIGGNVFDKNKTVFTSEQLISAINASRIKWQEARVKKVFVNNKSIMNFQSSIMKNKNNFLKYGVMYGTYDDEKKHIYVQNIQEENTQDKIEMTFGLQRVGIILSHPPRDKNDYIISGREIMLSAKEQSIYGDHNILITISCDTKTHEMEVCSWQVSEQCVNLYRIGTFLEINNKKNNKHLFTSYPLETSKSCSIEKSSIVDTHWFFAPIAIEQFEIK